jgi:hypothetical protein
MVNIRIYNHPSKLFAKENHEAVVALMCALCTERGLLQRHMMQAWFLR